ncbi:unnamed protein product [Tuber aestivum]|uniref:GPI anchored serine-threonine rich protein n=1 Tax=Tuber aestivum TaxID=59557 RepID=A0A292PYW1_9PEZI|nr:unnamed protein product [Tuber aestivum]
MKLTILTLLSVAGTVVSASGGLALRAGNCPATASNSCGNVAGGLKDCCPEGTTCTIVGRKTYCCSPGDEMCSQGHITACALPMWGVNASGYCTPPSPSGSGISTNTTSTLAPTSTSTSTGYTTITAVPTSTGIVTDPRPMPNITITNAAAGAPSLQRGVSIGGWLGALVLGYMVL